MALSRNRTLAILKSGSGSGSLALSCDFSKLALQFQTIKIWFSNKRQKRRREKKTESVRRSPQKNIGFMLFTDKSSSPSKTGQSRVALPIRIDVEVGGVTAQVDIH